LSAESFSVINLQRFFCAHLWGPSILLGDHGKGQLRKYSTERLTKDAGVWYHIKNAHRSKLQHGCLSGLVATTDTLHFNGHFQGGPGLAGTRMSPFWIVLEIRVMEVVVTARAIRRAKLQSECHHKQTNT